MLRTDTVVKKNPHAAALSKLGAKKGGKARWKGVPPEERSEILRRAVKARWNRAKKTKTMKKGW
jgi:hypothetical protein